MAIPVACLVSLTPAAAWADNGATLTVPAQVQASATTAAVLQPSFSYPEPTPFCTVGVDFTWDGSEWLSEFPTKNGSLCVAGGVNASAPAGQGGTGSHQVCAMAGPRYRDCKAVAVVLVADSAVPATPAPSGLAAAPPPTATQAVPPGPVQVPSNAPAIRTVNAVVNGLSPQQRLIGVALVAVGVLGLLAIAVRRLLLGRRRKAAPLPSPRMPPRQR
jgi:hypothetical protein